MSVDLFSITRSGAPSIAAGLLLLGSISIVSAQVPAQQDISRPTTSPYLNLLNNRNNQGLNYFTQVRPQQEFRAFGAEMSQEIRGLQMQGSGAAMLDRGGNHPLGVTGHPVTWLNTGGYFGTGRSGGGMPSTVGAGSGGGLINSGGGGGGGAASFGGSGFGGNSMPSGPSGSVGSGGQGR